MYWTPLNCCPAIPFLATRWQCSFSIFIFSVTQRLNRNCQIVYCSLEGDVALMYRSWLLFSAHASWHTHSNTHTSTHTHTQTHTVHTQWVMLRCYLLNNLIKICVLQFINLAYAFSHFHFWSNFQFQVLQKKTCNSPQMNLCGKNTFVQIVFHTDGFLSWQWKEKCFPSAVNQIQRLATQ